MGNKKLSSYKHTKTANMKRMRRHAEIIREKKKKELSISELEAKKYNTPKSLVILCERAIKKYKLIPDPAPKKPFTSPDTFSVVGGKPLRKRSEGLTPGKYKVAKTKKKEPKRFNPKSLAELCKIITQEYNLLPQTEELLVSRNTPLRKRSRSQSDAAAKSLRGRPRKSTPQRQNDTPISIQIKRSRGRPPKDPNAYEKYFSSPPTDFAEQPMTNVRIKEELDLPPDIDPLQDEDEGYTVMIKEETCDSEDEEITQAIPANPVPFHQTTTQSLIINPEAHLQVPGPSRIGVTRTPKFMTVVMDEYQIFANSIAEQLRTLPANRALLLQLDIQSMLDNEKQLISDEN